MQYIGFKMVIGKPMNRLEYNEYRGWTLPPDEDGSDEGFLVEYTDPANKSNHPDHAGYISWSPKDVFDYAYREVNALPFSLALEAVLDGRKVTRKGWNGKEMFIFLVNGSTFQVNRPPLLGIYPEGTEIKYRPHIDMRTADGSVVPWVASQSDLLSEDWAIVD